MIDLSKIVIINQNPPVNEQAIDEVEKMSGNKLPLDYRELLQVANGFLTADGVFIYGTDDIIDRNLTWETPEYAKGYLAVGDDSGGTVFLMLCKEDSKEVLAVDQGVMDPDHATIIASDFQKWILEGCLIKERDSLDATSSYTQLHDVLLVAQPDGGTKDLIQLKKLLRIDTPISELLKGSKIPPFVLLEKIPYGKAISRLEQLGELANKVKLVLSRKE